jgi:hypothetical protein
MSNIRITYSGFVSFFVSLVTVVVGTAYTLILTRTLSQEEYGVWGLIVGLIGYVILINQIIAYWSTRETARKIESGKTAVFASMILSTIGFGIFIVSSIIMSNQTGIDSNVFFLASILIPIMFLHGILFAINFGWKPHVGSYANFVLGISQVPLAIIFVYYLELGVSGIIFTSFIAYSLSSLVLFRYAKNHLRSQIRLLFLKSWIKLSWLPLYPGLSLIVDNLGIIIYSTITGSVLGLAIWTAANVIPGIIRYVGQISLAVYPRLLEGGDKKYLEDNILNLFYFNFLMLGIAITFAKPALFALNPIYQEAYLILVILAIRNFFFVLSNVFIQNLGGNETIDVSENPTFTQYIKSKLFYPHTVKLIHVSIATSILPIGLIILIQNEFETIDLLTFWATILLVFQIPLTTYLYILTKRNLVFTVNYKIILKYLFAFTLSFSVSHIVTENFLVYNENIFQFIPQVLMFLVLAISLYCTLTFVIDKKTRNLVYAIINEIKEKIP